MSMWVLSNQIKTTHSLQIQTIQQVLESNQRDNELL